MNKLRLLSLVTLILFLLVSCRHKTPVNKEFLSQKKDNKEIKKPADNKFLFNEYLFKKYHNSRFDYCVWYPSKVLVPHGESENGDGQSFMSDDMKFRMIVSAVYNIGNEKISKIYSKDYDFYSSDNKFHLTYCAKKDNNYVISDIME